MGHMPWDRHIVKNGGAKHDPSKMAIGDAASHVYRLANLHMSVPDGNSGKILEVLRAA